MPLSNRAAYNAYMRAYMSKRYYRRLVEVKKRLGNKCRIRGCERKDLQIDHVDPGEKLFSVTARLAGCSEEKLERELKKCQLLCSKHHTVKSVTEKGKVLARGTHGTLSSYRYCRCDECKAANSEYNRKWKRERKRRKIMERKQIGSGGILPVEAQRRAGGF